MKQAGKHSRHHTVLTRLLHNRNSYRTSSILLQTTNHFVTVAPSPSFLPFVSLLPILRIPIRCCNQRRNKFFRKENRCPLLGFVGGEREAKPPTSSCGCWLRCSFANSNIPIRCCRQCSDEAILSFIVVVASAVIAVLVIAPLLVRRHHPRSVLLLLHQPIIIMPHHTCKGWRN